MKRSYAWGMSIWNIRATARRYGISEKSVVMIRLAPCMNCGRSDRRSVIDHDHDCCRPMPTRRGVRTGSCSYCRRGLACERCNHVIGHAGDDPERLRRIADNLAAVLPTVAARLARKPQQVTLFDLPEAS